MKDKPECNHSFTDWHICQRTPILDNYTLLYEVRTCTKCNYQDRTNHIINKSKEQ